MPTTPTVQKSATAPGAVAPFAWVDTICRSRVAAHAPHPHLGHFVREAVLAGDCYVDADAARGVADVAALAGAKVVLLYRGRSRGEAIPSVPAAVHEAAQSGGAPVPVVVVGPTPIDGCVPALGERSLVHVHAGDAAQVAPLLAGSRGFLRSGRLGAVAWRNDDHRAGTPNAASTAMAALSRGGFSHFALSTDGHEAELVPVVGTALPDMIFSLSEAFLARAGEESDAAPAPLDLRAHATALFDAITEDLTPGASALGRVPRRGELAQLQLEMAWANARVVSFDVFDTLVVRKAAAPTDVFLHLAAHAPFAALGMAPGALRDAREMAEGAARRRAYTLHNSAEATLTEIHTQLAADLRLAADVVPSMVQAEQTVELTLCTAHPALKVWFERARHDGKVVWCISDTYHDGKFLSALLEHCGYDLTSVHVVSSADRRCSKGEGRLFRELLPAMGVPSADVLHIGDNPVSDQDVPAAMGIQTVLHPWAACRATDAPGQSAGDSATLGLAMIGARTAEPPPPFWWRFGYSVGGPLLVGFSLWLHQRFVADGINRAYFLLRDGEVLREVFSAVAGPASGVQTALLESSRRAFALPALDTGIASPLTQLTASENPRPVREFLERLGVNAEPFAAVCAAEGFKTLDDLVLPGDRAAVQRVARVMRHHAVAAVLRERSHEERALLLDYLDAEGVLSGGRAALVDIGWNGTIQKSLAAILAHTGRSQEVCGYYIGTYASAHLDTGSSRVSGYLFESGHPLHRARAVTALPQLVEFICTTTRGSLQRFERVGGSVSAVHSPVDHSEDQIARQQQMRSGILAFAHHVADMQRTFDISALNPEAALRRLERVITAPTAEEAQQIGDIAHGDGLGADRSRKLASFTSGRWSLASIHQDRSASYWPAGLAARRDPQALVLRAVNWLLEDAGS